ncbi:MAG TPA: SMC family ATPase, partial [Microbacterium sp.]|uniref:SMC family ATPase n=1 Tax=Microbacterium sp. TaxID=51671 RepID=UPI002B4745CF
EAATAAGAETGIRKDIDADAARLAAARELVTAEQRLTEAAAGELAASARAQEAGNAVVRLLQQRLDNHAGELAAELRPGEPCMVCGSHDHPEPAVSGAEAITDETIDRAVAERDSLRLLEADAAQNARDAQQRRNELAERSGGATVAQVEARLEELRAQAAVAAEARERGEALTRERAQIDEQAKAAAARVDLLNAQVMQLTAEIATADHDLRSAQKRIDDARGDTSSVQARIAETRTLRTAAAALVAALRTLTVTQAAAADARTDLDARIAQSPFADPEAASAALRDDESREHMTLKVAEYGQKVSTSRARLFDLELQMLPDEPVDLAFLQRRHTDADLDYQDAVDRRSRAEGTARTLAEVLAKVRAQYDAVGPLVSQAEQIATLADAVSGRGANTHRMTLEAFVLAAELEEIVAQANVRLDEMSSGRYRLQHTDARAARNAASGLGIEVMDAFTGVARPATSLSGGETFLASLALALGLADVVTARAGGIRLDTLFVDEGFGSLDSETLDVAMDTLESLRHGGRTVGVISHVEAMREQLPTQLRVTAGAHGPSRIEQQAPLGVV